MLPRNRPPAHRRFDRRGQICYDFPVRSRQVEKMVNPGEVKQRIETALPGAEVQVSTFSGNDHFQAVVAAPQFKGKSLVEQHRMVYAAVDGLLGGRSSVPPEIPPSS